MASVLMTISTPSYHKRRDLCSLIAVVTENFATEPSSMQVSPPVFLCDSVFDFALMR